MKYVMIAGGPVFARDLMREIERAARDASIKRVAAHTDLAARMTFEARLKMIAVDTKWIGERLRESVTRLRIASALEAPDVLIGNDFIWWPAPECPNCFDHNCTKHKEA